jgi:hypothetical protein
MNYKQVIIRTFVEMFRGDLLRGDLRHFHFP